MLAAAFGGTRKQTFRLGFVAGFAFWLASLYWLLHMPVTGYPILAWIALAAYNAVFQAIWVWLCWKCFPGASNASGRQVRLGPVTSRPGEFMFL
jgi:hypothetical protein